ncbi:MAG: hypothetical protein ACRC33_25135, partial [Gemmataceae bacterium]
MRHHSDDVDRDPRRPRGPLTAVLATVIAAVALAQPARTQGPAVVIAPPTAAKPPEAKAETKAEVKTPGKKIAFSMDSKPWSGMFKWVGEQTGIPVIYT